MSRYSDAAFESGPKGGEVGAGNGPSEAAGMSAEFEDVDTSGLEYICGDCGFRQKLKKLQTCRCVACGYRILYKARTKRLVTFKAR